MKVHKLIAQGALIGSLVGHLAHAKDENSISRLPFFGKSDCAAKGKIFKTESVKKLAFSDVLFDRDCTTAFVKPPKAGQVRVDELFVSGYTGKPACMSLFKFQKSRASLADRLSDILNKPLAEMVRELQNATEATEGMAEFAAQTWGNPVANARLSLTSDWSEIVHALQKENAGSFIVQTLPISNAAISFRDRKSTENGAEDLMRSVAKSTRGSLDGVTNSTIVSSRIKIDGVTAYDGSEWVLAAPITGSLAASIELNEMGLCPLLYEENGSPRHETKAAFSSLTGAIAPNVLYKYPVHSESGFKVHINHEVFAQRIKSQVNRETGLVSTRALLPVVSAERYSENTAKQDYAMLIEFTEDMYGQGVANQEMVTQIIDDIKESVVQNVLANERIARLVETMPEPTLSDSGTMDRIETHQQQTCRRSLFRKKCSNHVYQIRIPIVKLESELESVTRAQYSSNAGELREFNTYSVFETMGFDSK